MNSELVQFVGWPGYLPKPIDCKAKTAKIPTPSGGLVVDPYLVPKAYQPDSLNRVRRTWNEFKKRDLAVNPRYSVVQDPSSPDYGCVLRSGSKLHGDRDVKDVTPVGRERQNLALVPELHGQRHMRGPLF